MSETQLSIVEQQKPARTPLSDLRSHALAVPVEVMQTALAEYAQRRETFREWLLTQLVEGLHYGYVPGTEPKFDARGNMVSRQWDKRQNDGKGGYKEVTVSQKSWQAKRCLYKAGADFMCDLMGVVDVYEADMAGWQQLGSPAGVFVYACRMYPRGQEQRAETLVGEGRGVRKVGTKGGDENNAIKMAKKAAKVDAVINAYGLSDLFTQDIDEKPRHENPEHNQAAPKAGTRNERTAGERGENSTITADELAKFTSAWQEENPNASKADFTGWCHAATLQEFGADKLSKWTWGRLKACKRKFDEARGLPVGGLPESEVPF